MMQLKQRERISSIIQVLISDVGLDMNVLSFSALISFNDKAKGHFVIFVPVSLVG